MARTGRKLHEDRVCCLALEMPFAFGYSVLYGDSEVEQLKAGAIQSVFTITRYKYT